MKGYRASFDKVADLYAEARPGYPDESVAAVLKLTRLSARGRILEVGPGTGQITLPFAERGFEIVGLELGPNLAELARRKLAAFPNVSIVTSAFEAWTGEADFDLVLSAQAFHWIPVGPGLTRVSQLLKPGGAAALLWQLDASSATAFNRATNPLWDKYVRDDPDRPKPPSSYEIYRDALTQSELFTKPVEHAVSWQKTYTKEAYIKLVSTFSDHITLSEATRRSFYAELGQVIDTFGGEVTRFYRTALLVSHKVS